MGSVFASPKGVHEDLTDKEPNGYATSDGYHTERQREPTGILFCGSVICCRETPSLRDTRLEKDKDSICQIQDSETYWDQEQDAGYHGRESGPSNDP
jgi:hypothetical protein